MNKFTSSVVMSFLMGLAMAGAAAAQSSPAQGVTKDMSLPRIYVAPARNPGNGGGGAGGGAGDNLGDHIMRRVLNANGNRIVNIREVHMVTGGRIRNVGAIEMDNSKIIGLADADADADAVNLRTLLQHMNAARDNMGDQVMRTDVLFGDGKVIDMSVLARDVNGGFIPDAVSGRPTTDNSGLRIEKQLIRNMAAPLENGDAANKKYVDDMAAGARDNLGDHVMLMALNANGNKIVNLASPSNPQDAVNLETLTSTVGSLARYSAGDGISFLPAVGGVTPIAVDATVVRTENAQSIGGHKTFTHGAMSLVSGANTPFSLRFLNRYNTPIANFSAGGGDTMGNVRLNTGQAVARDGNFHPLFDFTHDGGLHIRHTRNNNEFGDRVRDMGYLRTGDKIDDRSLILDSSAGNASVILNSGRNQRNDILGMFVEGGVHRVSGRIAFGTASDTRGIYFQVASNDQGVDTVRTVASIDPDTMNFRMSNPVGGVGGRIINLTDPIDPQDAVNLRTMQTALGGVSRYSAGDGVSIGAPVAGVAPINVDLSVVRTAGAQTIDGSKDFTSRVRLIDAGAGKQADLTGGQIKSSGDFDMHFGPARTITLFNDDGSPNSTVNRPFSAAIKADAMSSANPELTFMITAEHQRNRNLGEIMVLSRQRVMITRDIFMRKAGLTDGTIPGSNIYMEGGRVRGMEDPVDVLDAVNLRSMTKAINDSKASPSDIRLKENIQPITPEAGMEMVRRFEPVTYDFKADGSHAAGVIAQELQKVMPYAVHTRDNGTLAVEYTQMIAPMISAIKSLDSRVSALEEAR